MKIDYEGSFAQRNRRNPTLIIDFDGTIAKDEYPNIGEPEPGVREAMTKLKQAGFDVVIYSCRLNRADGRPIGDIEKNRRMMEEWLAANGIPYDRIDMGYDGKPRGDHIIDNKAIHYGGDGDWERISSRILSGGRPS